jgi:hypothetical protein
MSPGENRLTVDVDASWAKASGAATTVWVRRPPKLIGLASTAVGVKPFVDLTAEVDALDGFPPTELILDGRVHQDVARSQSGPASASGVVRWKLVAKNVSLQQGRNDFSVAVRNGEGESAPAAVGGLVYAPPPPPKATVTWLSPAADGNQEQPDVDVHVRIESTTPLQSAALSIAGSANPIADLKPASTAEGRFVYEIRQHLKVEPGRRSLALRVLNGGGETQAERAVNYIFRPAIIKLLALEAGSERVEARRAADGSAAFTKVATAKQTLVGEVAFADANSPARTAPATLRVIVNGLQQPTVDLEPAEGNVRRFRTPVALNKLGPNHVFAEVVGLPIADDCNVEGVVLGCEKPNGPTRLHLVLIGVGEEDEAKLRAEALEAFKGTAFELMPRHHAVCGYVTAPTIREAVDRLRMELVESGRRDGGDVVVFYFRGQEAIEDRKLKLLTSEPAWLARSKFDASDLATRFADIPGAQLLALDVSRLQSGGEADPPFRRMNAGLFQYLRPPKEAPVLFSCVKEAIPTVRELGELQKVLAKAQLPAGVQFNPFVPLPLAELVVNRR